MIEDFYYGGSDVCLWMWMVVIGVVVIGSFLVVGVGLLMFIDMIYFNGWNLIVLIFGGVLFGYGMVMFGNCGYGVLVCLGGGDLRLFVIVLVMGLVVYVILLGFFVEFRVFLFFFIVDGYGGLVGILSVVSGLFFVVIGVVIGVILIGLGLLWVNLID